jgi:transcriptional regulator with XRE-family HTH domain
MREVAGHGLNQFADQVGVSPSWLSRIERDLTKNPSPEVLKRLAEGLGTQITQITKPGRETT